MQSDRRFVSRNVAASGSKARKLQAELPETVGFGQCRRNCSSVLLVLRSTLAKPDYYTGIKNALNIVDPARAASLIAATAEAPALSLLK